MVMTPSKVGVPFDSFLAMFDLTVDKADPYCSEGDGTHDGVYGEASSPATSCDLGSDGFSFSFGPPLTPQVGEAGYGLGIRVQFKTYVYKEVDVVVDGETTQSQYVGEHCVETYYPNRKRGMWELLDCIPSNKIRDRTNTIEIRWTEGHLTVLLNGQPMASHVIEL